MTNCKDRELLNEPYSDADQQIFWSANLGRAPEPAESTPRSLGAAACEADLASSADSSESSSADDRSVAIVGIGGFFPGSDDLNDFRERLFEQQALFQLIPEDHRPEPAMRDRSGAFISNLDRFDAELFHVSALEAKYMDPRLRLLMMATWHALEDACYTPEVLQKSKVDVYVAAETSAYAEFLAQTPITAYSPLGSTGWVLANRLSHTFRFRGKSLYLDTGCSGSLVALHQGIQALRRGECDYALVASANVLLGKSATGAFISQEALGMQTTTQGCFPFQNNASGFLPAEAIVAVLLKRRSDAVRDRDNIHGIVRGSAVNHAGGFGSFFMPSALAQAEVMAHAYEDAAITPDKVGYVEAHGASTVLADLEELKALLSIERGLARSVHIAEPQCKVSTIKPNAGHANAASGLLALIRALGCVNRGVRLGILDFAELTEKVSLERSRLYLNSISETWERPRDIHGVALPRRAAVNNFGAGGVNAHVILEEFIEPSSVAQSSPTDSPDVWYLPLSAQTEEQLVSYAERLMRFLQEHESPSAAVLEHAYVSGRRALQKRVVFRFREASDLLEKLQRFVSSRGTRGYHQKSAAQAGDSGTELFTRHEQLQTFVSELKQANDKGLLFDLWARGMEEPLKRYFNENPQPRCSLPTYPFRLESYWVDCNVAETISSQTVESNDLDPVAAASGNPLLQHIAAIVGQPEAELELNRSMAQLGMSSLDVMALKYRLEKSLAMEVPATLLDLHAPIETLSAAVGRAGGDTNRSRESEALHPIIEPNPEAAFEPFPLTDLQSAIYSGRRIRLGGDEAGCHIYLELEAAQLDIERLNVAWQRLIDHHPMLRTVVLSSGAQQVRKESCVFRFNRFDFSEDADAVAAEKLARLRKRLSHKLYSADRWPLFDICVVRLSNGRSRVLFSIDEWIIDAHSLNLLLEQWAALYFDPTIALPATAITFRDCVVATARFEQSEAFERVLARAITRFSRLPPGPPIPLESGGRAAHQGLERYTLSTCLDVERWSAMKLSAARHRVSPTSVVLALFATLLRRFGENRPCTLNLTMLNRSPLHQDIQHLVGPFVSTHPFIADSDTSRSFVDVVRDTDRALKDAMDLSQVSGIRLVRELRSRGIVDSRFSLPVVFTSLLNVVDTRAAGSVNELFSPVYSISQTPQVNLDHQIVERDGRLESSWTLTSGAYCARTIEDLFAEFSDHLRALCDDDRGWLSPLEELPRARTAIAKPAVALVTDPQSRFAPFPLTTQQQAYGFARSRFHKGEHASCQVYCEISLPDCDIDRLRLAWRRCMELQPALVTRVGADGYQQVLSEIPDFEIKHKDLSHLSQEARSEELKSIKSGMMERSIPLGSWPYFDIAVSVLDARDACVHFTIDMVIADGPSIQQVIKCWLQMYHDPTLVLQPAIVTFRDYVMSLEAYRGTDAYRQDLEYWDRKVSGFAGGPKLPHVVPVPETVVRQRFSVLFEPWEALVLAARKRAIAIEDALLGAYLDVLARHSRTSQFEVVVPYWDRVPVHPEIDRVVGEFTMMSWVPACTQPASFSERCRAYAKERSADACHRAVNGIASLRRGGRQGQLLEYPVVFSLPLGEDQEADDLFARFEIGALESKTGGVEIDNITDVRGDRAGLHWDVAVNVFPPGFARQMFDEYVGLLRSLASGEATVWDERSSVGGAGAA